MGAVSQWEREAIGERTKDASRYKRGNGERIANIQYGYRLSPDGRHLRPDPAEQATLNAIRKLRQGGHSLRDIAAASRIRRLGHSERRHFNVDQSALAHRFFRIL